MWCLRSSPQWEPDAHTLAAHFEVVDGTQGCAATASSPEHNNESIDGKQWAAVASVSSQLKIKTRSPI